MKHKNTVPIPKQLLELFPQPAVEQHDRQSTGMHFHQYIHQVFFPQFVLKCMGYPDVHIVMVLLYVGLSGVGTVTTPAVSTGKAVPVSLSDGKYTTVIC